MPPPLGAGGIMFSGCPSVRPSVRSLKYPLLTCTWVRWSTRPTVTILWHVRLSVRRGFRAFAGERMEGMAWNFTCWCILTTFRPEDYGYSLLIFLILMLFWLSETVQIWGFQPFWSYSVVFLIMVTLWLKLVIFGVCRHYLENVWE